MIVVDTSALMAIIFGEPNADDYLRQLKRSEAVISTASLVETYVVAKRKAGAAGVEELNRLLQEYQIGVTSFDVVQVEYAQSGFDRFGKGRGAEPAALNLGDCFAYALAKSLDAPLLFKGDDFAKTDVKRVSP